jgi:hypothetical protein
MKQWHVSQETCMVCAKDNIKCEIQNQNAQSVSSQSQALEQSHVCMLGAMCNIHDFWWL